MATHKINRLTSLTQRPGDSTGNREETLYLFRVSTLVPCKPFLDEGFTLAELRIALRQCRGNKSPGPDSVTTALRNMSDADQHHLLHAINLVWTGQTCGRRTP